MSFMQRQITNQQKWVELDGDNGITVLPWDVLTYHEQQIADSVDGDSDAESIDLTTHFADYYDGSRINSVTVREGYGARLYAPGYMDCTDWAVFDTASEAEEYLVDMHGDDDEG